MLDKELIPCLEAVLFATGEPIELERLALGMQTDEAVLENALHTLKEKYDMTTMLIVTNPNGQEILFRKYGSVKKGDNLI